MTIMVYARYIGLPVNEKYSVVALYGHRQRQASGYYIENQASGRYSKNGFEYQPYPKHIITDEIVLFKTFDDAKLHISWILLGGDPNETH